MATTRLPLVAALLALVLALAACGDDDEDTGATNEPPAPAATQPETETETPPADEAEESGEISTDVSQKPAIPQPEGDPPDELEVEDVVEGDGDTAEAGALVTVHYVGINWSDGQEFDASWDRGEPFRFTLGAGEVIPGWDEGVDGMKVGGRRKLVIPPDMAYGAQGTPDGAIPPNETLVFVVDLEAVEQG